MNLADRFILSPAPVHDDGPSHVARVIDEADNIRDTQEEHLYELFHEQTKVYAYNFRRHHDALSASDHAIAHYHSAKDFDGFPWVALPGPTQAELEAANEPKSVSTRHEKSFGMHALSVCLSAIRSEIASEQSQNQLLDYHTQYTPGTTDPVDVYIFALTCAGLDPGCYYYHPPSHRLYNISYGNMSEKLTQAGITRRVITQSVAIVAFVGAFGRSTRHFGERGYRYILLETGMAAERLCYVAKGYGIDVRGVPVFVDDLMNDLVQINGVDEAVLFCVDLH